MKWWQLSWRNIWRHKRRSYLAMSVMALSVVGLLTAAGFMLASFHGLRESTIRGGIGHIQIGAANRVLQREELEAIDRFLNGQSGIRFAMQRITFEGLISNGPTTAAVIGSGVQPARETRLSLGFAPIVSGTGLPLDEQNPQPTALLGKDLAAKLGAKPGDNLTVLATTVRGVLNAVDVEVVGTFTTGVPEMDARQVLLPLAVAKSLLDTKGVSRVVVVLNETGDTANIADRIRRAFPKLRVDTWRELAPFYGQVVTLYRNIFVVLGLVILAVVCLSVMNAMLMAITERIREMGTMMALGIHRLRIRSNFAIEGFIMGALAGAAGLIIAAVLAMLINFAAIEMPPPPGRTTPYPLIIFIDPYAYAVLFAVMIASGALAAWLPTRRLASLEIVEALREN